MAENRAYDVCIHKSVIGLRQPQFLQSLRFDVKYEIRVSDVVDGLEVVEGVGRDLGVVRDLLEAGGAGVPIGHAVGRCLINIEIAGGPCGLKHRGLDPLAATVWVELAIVAALKELQLLAVSEHDPRQATRPGRKRAVALLAGRAAVLPVIDVKDRFVGYSPPHVVDIALLSEIDVVCSGGAGVLDQSVEQPDRLVVLTDQSVTKLVGRPLPVMAPPRTTGAPSAR